MTTKQMHKNRGSALLMVVGLLTILALLGGTFLVISRYERKQAVALESQPDPDAYAKAIAEMIQVKLLEDLFITSGSAPYTDAAGTNANTWLRYIDCPPTENKDDYDNFWLASAEAVSNSWAQMTGLLGTADRTGIANTAADSTGYAANSGIPYFDTDGDGYIDAKLSDLDVTMANGDSYVAAIRIIDLSALVNVNTAGEFDNSWTGQSIPMLIDLKGLVNNATKYGLINQNGNNGRFGNVGGLSSADTIDTSSMTRYYSYCGVRILNPESPTSGQNYKPYAISDETYLRFLSTAAQVSGRLATNYDASSGIATTLRKYLTTYNCSRSLPRHCYNSDLTASNPLSLAAMTTKIDISVTEPLGTANTVDSISGTPNRTGYDTRNRLYYQLCSAAGLNSSSPQEDRQAIAQYIANLWSATYNASGSTTPWPETESFEFTPRNLSGASAESFTVYGLTPVVVISEVFAAQFQPTALGTPTPNGSGIMEYYNNDGGFAYAVELYNPTNRAVDISNYILNCGVTATKISDIPTFTGSNYLNPNEKIVFYDFGGNCNEGATDSLGSNPPFDTSSGRWIRWSGGFDFQEKASGNLIELSHEFQDPARTTILIDKATVSNLDWANKNYQCLTEDPAVKNVTACHRALRDDDSSRTRIMVREFFQSPIPSPTLATVQSQNKLNQSNGVTTTNISLTDVYAGFDMNFKGTAITNFDDLLNIYTIGPTISTTKSLCDEFYDKKDDDFRGRANYTTIPSASSDYPDVPWICILPELTEVLQRDTTRLNSASQATRIYGKININTAPADVLKRLPFPTTLSSGQTVDLNTLVAFIISYRDNSSITVSGSTVNIRELVNAGFGSITPIVPAVRTNSEYKGFVTPGEILIPLLAYSRYLMDPTFTVSNSLSYYNGQKSLYNSVANLVTVNSDSYAAYITIGVGGIGDSSSKPKKTWRYLAVFDRSNCRSDTDKPEMLMMTPIGNN